jgi:hypothetical protein
MPSSGSDLNFCRQPFDGNAFTVALFFTTVSLVGSQFTFHKNFSQPSHGCSAVAGGRCDGEGGEKTLGGELDVNVNQINFYWPKNVLTRQ